MADELNPQPPINPQNEVGFYLPSDDVVSVLLDNNTGRARGCPAGENHLPPNWVGMTQAEIEQALGEAWERTRGPQPPSSIPGTFRVSYRRKKAESTEPAE